MVGAGSRGWLGPEARRFRFEGGEVAKRKGQGGYTPKTTPIPLPLFHFPAIVLAALSTARTPAVATSSSIPTPHTTLPSGATHST